MREPRVRSPLDVEAEMLHPQLEASNEKSGTERHVLSCLQVGSVERYGQVEIITAVSAEGFPGRWDFPQPAFRWGWGHYTAEKAEKEQEESERRTR